MSQNYYVIEKKDIRKAVEVLVEAYMEYPIYTIIKDKTRRRKLLVQFVLLSVKDSVRKGLLISLDKDIKEVALFKGFDVKSFDLSILRDITLSTCLIPFYIKKEERKQLFQHLKDMNEGKRKLKLPDKCKELALLAVHPKVQGQGRASKLVRPFLDQFAKQEYACMLMTNTIKNTEIYKKLGFEIIKDVYSKDSDVYTYYMLKNIK